MRRRRRPSSSGSRMTTQTLREFPLRHSASVRSRSPSNAAPAKPPLPPPSAAAWDAAAPINPPPHLAQSGGHCAQTPADWRPRPRRQYAVWVKGGPGEVREASGGRPPPVSRFKHCRWKGRGRRDVVRLPRNGGWGRRAPMKI